MSRLADISEPMVLDRLEAAAAASLLVESTASDWTVPASARRIVDEASASASSSAGDSPRRARTRGLRSHSSRAATSEQPRLAGARTALAACQCSRRAAQGGELLATSRTRSARRLRRPPNGGPTVRDCGRAAQGADTEERCEALVGLPGESQRQLGDVRLAPPCSRRPSSRRTWQRRTRRQRRARRTLLVPTASSGKSTTSACRRSSERSRSTTRQSPARGQIARARGAGADAGTATSSVGAGSPMRPSLWHAERAAPARWRRFCATRSCPIPGPILSARAQLGRGLPRARSKPRIQRLSSGRTSCTST